MEEKDATREASRPSVMQLALFGGDVETFEQGKDELNLAEFPIALVADYAKAGQLSVKFEDTITDRSTGKRVNRSVTVHGTEEWGLPTAQDDQVMMGLMQICFQTGWHKRFRFTRRQLCQLLHWSIGGVSYRRIYTALHRLSTTRYNYRYAWRDRAKAEWVPSHVFSYIQSLKVHEAGRPTRSGLCEVIWSDDFYKSLVAGNLKSIDFRLFVSLKSPIGKRLYRFLDKRFGAGRSTVSYDLKTLAFEKIGISRSYADAAQVKRLLLPAIDELEQSKYLARAPREERFEKIARGRWNVHFRRHSPAESKASRRPVNSSNLERCLTDLGVIPSEARKFVVNFPSDYLRQKIDEFSFRHPAKNPGGLLAASIRDDLPAPAGYRNPSQRAEDASQSKIKREEVSRRQRKQKNREKAVQAAEEAKRREAERRLRSLDEQGRRELETKAKHKFPTAPARTLYWTMVQLLQEEAESSRSNSNGRSLQKKLV